MSLVPISEYSSNQDPSLYPLQDIVLSTSSDLFIQNAKRISKLGQISGKMYVITDAHKKPFVPSYLVEIVPRTPD